MRQPQMSGHEEQDTTATSQLLQFDGLLPSTVLSFESSSPYHYEKGVPVTLTHPEFVFETSPVWGRMLDNNHQKESPKTRVA